MRYILMTLCKILIMVVSVLMALAYLTLLESKILASMQLSMGPQVVGIWGVLQPFADAMKLFGKETMLPTHANLMIFWIAPMLSLFLALVGWGVMPFGTGMVLADLNIGMLYLFAVSSLGVYAVLCSGWASNSSYPFLGALSASAQMMSYEVSMGLMILTVVLAAGSLNLTEMVLAQRYVWYIMPLFPACMMFFISSLAETFRPPFDLPEGETELVSGYNTEYSALNFGLFFLAEYSHIMLMSFFNALLFLGGWLPPLYLAPFTWVPEIIWLSIKVSIFVFLFVWTRASLPSISFDQLMYLGWKSYLPLSLAYFIFIAGMLMGFDSMPPLAY